MRFCLGVWRSRARIILELVFAQECYLQDGCQGSNLLATYSDVSFLQEGCQGSNLLATYSLRFLGKYFQLHLFRNLQSVSCGRKLWICENHLHMAIYGDLAITCLGQHCRCFPVLTVPGLCIVPRPGASTPKSLSSPTRINQICVNAGILWTHTLGQVDSKEWSPNHFVVCMTTIKYIWVSF